MTRVIHNLQRYKVAKRKERNCSLAIKLREKQTQYKGERLTNQM